MSKLLIKEPPLQVLPSLAVLVGLGEAIVLQQLHYQSLRSRLADGSVQKSIVDWHREDFRFMSKRTLTRVFADLRDRGLIVSEVVAVPGGAGGVTRELSMRVDHDALDALLDEAERSRQFGATGSSQSGVTPDANLASPPTNKGTTETTTAEPPKPPEGEGEVHQVFAEWVRVTDRDAARTQRTPKRVRLIRQALKSHGLGDCLAAVQNIGRSTDARTGYGRGTRFDDVEHVLGNGERIERWRDAKAPAAKPGHVAKQDDGVTVESLGPVDGKAAVKWGQARAELKAAMDEHYFETFVAQVFGHKFDRNGRLVLRVPAAILPEVKRSLSRLFVEALDGHEIVLVGVQPEAGRS